MSTYVSGTVEVTVKLEQPWTDEAKMGDVRREAVRDLRERVARALGESSGARFTVGAVTLLHVTIKDDPR